MRHKLTSITSMSRGLICAWIKETNLGKHRGSYMSAHVLLNLLNELGKRDKMRGLPSILSLFATSLINSIIQEHEC